MISRMQLPREMYMGGGISSLPYPSYGYAGGGITNSPNYMGGGYIDEFGRQRYGFGKFVKSITKPIAKVLDKIVPNEIKPALPFLAAALPFTQFGAGLFAKLGSLGGLASSQLAPYIGAGIIGAGSQMAQEGFDERGFNLPGLALSTLGGGAAASGTLGLGAGLREGIIAGNIGDKAITASDFATKFPGYTGPKTLEALSQMTDYAVAPFADPTPLLQDLPISSATIYPGATSVTGPDFLQSAENLTRSTAAASSDYLGEGSKSLGRLTSGDFSKVGGDLVTVGKTLGPGQIGATMETADRFARDALDEYNKQQAALGQTVAQSKADQIFFIRQAMQQAGFN